MEFLFSRIELDPSAVFEERELGIRDAEAFERLVADGLLRRDSFDVRSPPAIVHEGRVLTPFLGPRGTVEALDEEDSSFTPIALRVEDLDRWCLDIDKWAKQFAAVHSLGGARSELGADARYLGESAPGFPVVLALLHDDHEALQRLTAIAGFFPDARLVRVVCPTYRPPPAFSRHLESLQVVVCQLTSDGFDVVPALEAAARSLPAGKGREPVPGFRLSDDGRSANLHDRTFGLTTQQTQVVEMLLDAYLNRTPDLGQAYILERIGSTSEELRDTFRGNDAWGALIVPGSTRGTFRLNL